MRLRINTSPPQSFSPFSTSPVLGDLDPLLQTSPQHEKYLDVITTTGTHHWLCHDGRRCDKRKRRSTWMWIGSVLLLLLILGIYNVQSAWIALVSDSEWKTFSNRYQHRYHRLPNPSLRSWLSYAKYHNCETSDYYETIEEQMRQLRACNSTLSMDEMIQKVTSSSTRGYLVFRIENHKIILSQSHDIDSFPDFDGRPWWLAKAEHIYKLWAFKWLLHPTLRQLNSNITVVWNIMDEPADVMASQGLCLPVFSAVDEKLNLDANQTHPTTTILPNLLLPYHLSIGFFGTIRQRLVNYWLPPKAWNDRKDTITWRGSTTGQWEKGPRFHLVNTGPDGMNNPMVWQNISHDFAFVRVVQNKGQLLDEKYRVADPISYREMQDFKYVLDVDGNCMYARSKDKLNFFICVTNNSFLAFDHDH
jgi:hypothetical protein